MISLEDYLMNRQEKYPLTPIQEENAHEMIDKLELLEEAWGKPLILTSGYRPAALAVVGSNPNDAHTKCLGADLHDPNLELCKWLITNLDVLEDIGLWLESPQSSKNHCHVQGLPPKSGKRVFIA